MASPRPVPTADRERPEIERQSATADEIAATACERSSRRVSHDTARPIVAAGRTVRRRSRSYDTRHAAADSQTDIAASAQNPAARCRFRPRTRAGIAGTRAAGASRPADDGPGGQLPRHHRVIDALGREGVHEPAGVARQQDALRGPAGAAAPRPESGTGVKFAPNRLAPSRRRASRSSSIETALQVVRRTRRRRSR